VPSNPTLREHVRARAENRPGVYRMSDAEGRLLYVGKSIRVRTRLLSYFRAPRGEKAWDLIRESSTIDWEYLPNEFAALVREMRLIQKSRPRFNVQHKRRRIHSFVKITDEPAPRLLPVTRIARDGSTYFGPFPRVRAVAGTVRELAQVLGLRDCAGDTPVFFGDQLEIFGNGRIPRCMRADLGSCLAPCCGRPTAAVYRAAVALARRFLEGRAAEPLADLEARMRDASARMDFEYAALLRDRHERLRHFQDELTAFRGTVEDLTFLYKVPGFHGDDRLYLIRGGRIREDLPYPKGAAARSRVEAAVEEVYGATETGPHGLTPEEAAEIVLVARWFRQNPEERRRTVTAREWLERGFPAARRRPARKPREPRATACAGSAPSSGPPAGIRATRSDAPGSPS